MMIIMEANASKKQVDDVVSRIKQNQLKAHLSSGEERVIIGVIGDGRPIQKSQFIHLPGVDRIVPISRPYKLASREFHPASTRVSFGNVTVGKDPVVIIAGPCSIESRSQLLETALAVKEAGGSALRGGAYKPRTSPYSFQGMGIKGLELLVEAKELTGLPTVTEVMSADMVPVIKDYVDVLQIGARNMQNYALLHEAGKSQHPVLLKRGFSATIEELLMAAEYILSNGNRNVMLCERGIRTFETATRNTTDINAIPVLQAQSHLPVILDPSHSTGHWEYVTKIAQAGIAAGADGLIVEVHNNPAMALSDGGQSLKPERFFKLVSRIRKISEAVDRSLHESHSEEVQPALALGAKQ
jgi:3-deoxy-7-phosphoheptulonate synthase